MKINITKIFFLAVVFFMLLFFSNQMPKVYYLSWIGIFFFANIIFDFVYSLGKAVPIQSLMMLIAFLQWMIAPFFAYHFFPDSQFYFMQVPEEVYMSFIVPAILAFYVGLTIKFLNFEPDYVKLMNYSSQDEVLRRRGFFLYFLGFGSLLLLSVVPSSLNFAFFLLSKLHFIGAFYLFAHNIKYKYWWLLGAFLPVMISSGESTIFHDLLLWGGFVFIIYAFITRIRVIKKFSILALGVFSILFIQYVKTEYREVLGGSAMVVGQKNSGADVMLEIANQKYTEEGVTDDYYQDLIDRLNQGWIIARIMYVVPDYVDFAEGETINEGLLAALVPRFLNPNKVKSGGANFERFTGMTLVGTSMNIGLVGEAYANYGVNGGIFFMLIMGLFFNLSLYILKRYSLKVYEIILWIPFLFLYVVKAEDDFATMINQFTKAVLLTYFIFWIFKKYYPRNYSNINEESLRSNYPNQTILHRDKAT